MSLDDHDSFVGGWPARELGTIEPPAGNRRLQAAFDDPKPVSKALAELLHSRKPSPREEPAETPPPNGMASRNSSLRAICGK